MAKIPDEVITKLAKALYSFDNRQNGNFINWEHRYSKIKNSYIQAVVNILDAIEAVDEFMKTPEQEPKNEPN